jgi:hypothetical protein
MTLIFYEIEEYIHKKSYSKKLNDKAIRKFHKKLCGKFKIKTKLELNNKTYGYYDTENDIICVPENVTLGILIHEVAHAYEFKKYGETFHKNRLFDIINEMNIYTEKTEV